MDNQKIEKMRGQDRLPEELLKWIEEASKKIYDLEVGIGFLEADNKSLKARVEALEKKLV